jgi:hypothetical protein
MADSRTQAGFSLPTRPGAKNGTDLGLIDVDLSKNGDRLKTKTNGAFVGQVLAN